MSGMQIEKTIREQRTIEAVRKQLMGMHGKIGTIVRHLGTPIIYQGGGMCDVRSIEDYTGELYYPAESAGESLPVFDEESDYSDVEGYLFDGLSRGLHMEIKYLDTTKTLTVLWRGYPVYREIAGELYAYVPKDDWEKPVDRLYDAAKIRAIEAGEVQKAADEEKARHEYAGFVRRLRMRWGL